MLVDLSSMYLALQILDANGRELVGDLIQVDPNDPNPNRHPCFIVEDPDDEFPAQISMPLVHKVALE